MPRFPKPELLQSASPTQKRAFAALENLRILEILKPFRATLVGTFPLGIDIETSDLDIICEVRDFEAFKVFLRRELKGFGPLLLFWVKPIQAQVCRFRFDGFDFEIFAQDRPVALQNGYRHMLAEYHILEAKGQTFREEIIRLKRSGLKTEPAFARALGLEGDPFDALLRFENGFPGGT